MVRKVLSPIEPTDLQTTARKELPGQRKDLLKISFSIRLALGGRKGKTRGHRDHSRDVEIYLASKAWDQKPDTYNRNFVLALGTKSPCEDDCTSCKWHRTPRKDGPHGGKDLV